MTGGDRGDPTLTHAIRAHLEFATAGKDPSITGYVERLRRDHQATVHEGRYTGCTCGSPLCAEAVLIVHIDNLTAAYEQEHAKFVAETARAAAAAVPDRAAPTEGRCPGLHVRVTDSPDLLCVTEDKTGARCLNRPAAPTEGAGELERLRNLEALLVERDALRAERDALRAENAALERQNEVQVQMVRQFAAERDALRDTVRAREAAIDRLLRWSECHEEVTRRGEAQPCEKAAVALRIDEGHPYPVCAYHARAPMVELTDWRAALVPPSPGDADTQPEETP